MMPTNQEWIDEQTLMASWSKPLTSNEVSECFTNLKHTIQNSDHTVNILFDIEDAGFVPVQAPMHFIRSEITSQPSLGSIAVIGTDPIAQILARTAIRMTRHNILFFCDKDAAMEYLKTNQPDSEVLYHQQ